MARYENKDFNRSLNIETGDDIFTTPGGLEYDLSGMRFLGAGIDTIRQIFNCNLKSDVLISILDQVDNQHCDVIELAGIEWKVKKSGKQSGYQFILKNLDAGFVVLLKHFYKEADQRSAHIKIEATPQIIHELGLVRVSNRIREVAAIFADTLEASGIAVHLACDMKGLQLPDDFEHKLHTRSKRSYKVNGISNIEYDASATAFIYGLGETYTFGNASGLQMCLYDKTKEAMKSGKLNYWENRWKTVPSLEDCFTSEYKDGSDGNEADTVHRLEFRLHHTILKQFENGNFDATGNMICIREAKDLKPHLQALWIYCLQNFQLVHSSMYIHPIWQKIRDDVRFAQLDGHPDFFYKRGYNSPTKKLDGSLRRNVAMWLGNAIKLAAANCLTTEHVCGWIMKSGFEIDLAEYFNLRVFGDSSQLWLCLFDFVDGKMRDHRLNGIAA
jgi:hypothetical protein